MTDSFEHFQQQMSGMFDCSLTLFRQDGEKPLDKTAEMTDDAASPSFMYDPSTSFASWLSSQDFDSGKVVVPPPPHRPHLLGDDDDDDTSTREELLYNNGASAEKYDGSKPFVEWLSSRDAENVVLNPSSPRKRRARFEGIMFQSPYEQQQVEGGKEDISVCNLHTDAIPATVPENICSGNDFARMIAQSCGCTIIMQLNDLLDTRHCDGDIQGNKDDNNVHHHNEICVDDDEAVEVPLDSQIHRHNGHVSYEEETYTTEREEMEEICLNDSFESHHNGCDEVSYRSEKRIEACFPVDEMNLPAVTPENIPDTQLNDGEEALATPEREEGNEEDFPIDEMNALAVTPRKLFEEKLDDGPRKKLSQMLVETSLFQTNNNAWMSSCQPNNNATWSGCSVDDDYINTVDSKSLDHALSNDDEIFRNTQPMAPPSLSQEVNLLGASLSEPSTSSGHDGTFERLFYQENTTKPIAYDVDVSPLKKVAETRASFLDRTQSNPRREDKHSRLASISGKEMEPKDRTRDNSRREDSHSRLSSISGKEMEPKDRTRDNSRREDSHSRRSSVSSREMEPKDRTRDNLRREDSHSRLSSISSREIEPKDRTRDNSRREDSHSRRSSNSGKEMEPKDRTRDNLRREDSHSRRSSVSSREMEPKGGKENTIIFVSVRGRRGKEKYARHARKQRLSSKVPRLIP